MFDSPVPASVGLKSKGGNRKRTSPVDVDMSCV